MPTEVASPESVAEVVGHCSNCRAPLSVRRAEAEGQAPPLKCARCGYRVRPGVETRGIGSLASAPIDAGAASKGARFDPEFAAAVAAGHLTPAQAHARGNRRVFVQRLVERYGLSSDQAHAVADNRIRYAEVARDRGSPQTFETKLAPRSRSATIKIVAFALVLLALVAVVGRRWAGDRESPVQSRTISESQGVFTDASGRVVRVVASEPQEVLVSFCENVRGAGLDVVGVMPAAAGSSPVRVGVMRETAASDRLLAIAIRRDPLTGRWFSGDGVRPLVPSAAPADAMKALRRG